MGFHRSHPVLKPDNKAPILEAMRSVFRLWALAGFLVGCADGSADFTISGAVKVSTGARARAAAARTITHVMAVDPETAAPRRTIASVGADGSFELGVESGRPYVLVFIDDSAVGPEMAVGIFRAGTLDTVSPQLAGHLDLGDVKVDPGRQTASSGIAYDTLLASLGLSAGAAELLGSIDDLSLRYANPDIDGDGVIDLEQDHSYGLDFHVRSDLRRGSASGPSFTVDDITDQFLPDSGADAATPVLGLTSIYALYPASLDSTAYVPNGPPSRMLDHGGAFTAFTASGPAPAGTSFSALGFGDQRGFGPDYDLEHDAGLELPGSDGEPATLEFTLGAVGKTLTFTNVVTRDRASLTATGTPAIFIRLDTDGGNLSRIDYRWMKRVSGGEWAAATAEEIAVAIGSAGGFVSFHLAPSWSNEVGVAIPAQPSGTVSWPGAPTRTDAICGLAVSYDDKLGLRHFIGGVAPRPGVTCTP